MRRAPASEPVGVGMFAGWITVLSVVLILVAIAAGFGVAGFVRTWHTHEPSLPTFLRPTDSNCEEVFFCMNSSDPNPSYLKFLTAGPSPQSWLPVFGADSSVFDVSDPYATIVRVSGTYQFTVFAPMVSFVSNFTAAVLITRDPGVLLQTPALSGALGSVEANGLTGVPTMAASITAIATLEAGTPVRVGYVVDSMGPMVTPGAYFGGVLLARA